MSEPKIPESYPDPEWTPKQVENWENSGEPVYELIETEEAREWYRRTWRPKKRNEGMIEHDHVKFGTPEDYVKYNVEDYFDPWGSFDGVMMRHMTVSKDKREELDEHVTEIAKAKLKRLKETNPGAAQRLLTETKKVASLYGVES